MFAVDLHEVFQGFNDKVPYPHVVAGNVLHDNTVSQLQQEILSAPDESWDRYDNPFERKFTWRNKNNLPAKCRELFNYLESDDFMDTLSDCVGQRLVRDEQRLLWGIHKYKEGDYLDIHLDAGIHAIQKIKKYLTFGIYLSKDWKEENQGHLELWEGNTTTLKQCAVKILPKLNTMFAFKNSDIAWHGNPTPVVCPNGEVRILLTISYLADVPLEGTNVYEKALFVTRPGEFNPLKERLRLQRVDPSKYKDIYRYKKPTIVTITGIRPDFIRMAALFKRLDENFNHVLIHTGQHFDPALSGVFFDELNIRKPDFVLDTGISAQDHTEQLSYLSATIPKLLRQNGILPPTWILFLGDSNTAGVSFPLKKEGYRICHVEAGMRSGDRRMLEEINRTVCDHCSDLLFVYHDDYKDNLARENIINNVHVVGNTIVEVCRPFAERLKQVPKRKDIILMDIHRPENFKDAKRLRGIIEFANNCIEYTGLPVRLLYFKRLMDSLATHCIDLGKVEIIPLMPYGQYLDTVYHSAFLISDSGTGQEEPALFGTRVFVPRDFTERPQSYVANCSFQIRIDSTSNLEECMQWYKREHPMDVSWLGNGNTSQAIIKVLTDNFLLE